MTNNKFNLSKGEEKKSVKFNLSKSEEPKDANLDSTQKLIEGLSTAQPKKKNRLWWRWLVLFSLLIIAVIFFLKKCSSGGSDTPERTSIVPPPLTDTLSVIGTTPEEIPEKPEDTLSTIAKVEKGKLETPLLSTPYKQGESYKVYQFPFGDSNYSQSDPELDKLAKVLVENPNVQIQILAYTDNVGPLEFNQALSTKRAKAIYDYLISRGVEKNRLSYQGKGISTKYSNNAENRRAEFLLK